MKDYRELTKRLEWLENYADSHQEAVLRLAGCEGAELLLGIHFGSESVEVYCLYPCGQHVTSSFPMHHVENWLGKAHDFT